MISAIGWRALVGSIALAWAVAIPSTAEEVRYRLTDLGTIPYGLNSYARAINANGQVTGVANNAANHNHAFLYSNGTMRDLGQSWTWSGGNDINDSGEMTGWAGNSAGTRAFLYKDGGMMILGTLPGYSHSSRGEGINASGQVVGTSEDDNHFTRAFLYSGEKMVDLGTLGGPGSMGYAINANAQVTGGSYTSAMKMHAYLYSGGKMTDLGTLGGDYSYGRAINAGGQIAGAALTEVGAHHAFFYDGQQMIDLGTLGGGGSEGCGINVIGQIVGASATSANEAHAFVYEHGIMTDLNRLIDPALGWTLTEASSINDLGQIAGVGVNADGATRAVLLTPIPEPACLWVLGITTVGILRRRKV